jgi:hypothetical protein
MHVVSAQVLEQWTCLRTNKLVGQVLTGQTALFEILMRRYNERPVCAWRVAALLP